MTLVGRTTAIKTLTDAFTDCAEGCFRTVVVEGPTGCGKSALVHLLIERAATAGAVVLCATGFPAERRTAWSVVRRLLADRPGPPLRESTADRASRIGDMPALCAELRAVSEGRPLVLCVDDVHHADAESRAFVQYLARSARPARMLLVVAGTVHHEQGDPAFATELMRRPTSRRVRLERLGPAEVAALAERAGCSEHPAFLHESSGGNPLLLRALLEEYALQATAGPRASGLAPARPGTRHAAPSGIRRIPADRRRPTASAPRTPDVDGPFAQAVRACLYRAGATAAGVARAAALLDNAATPERIAELAGIAPPAVRQSLAGLHEAGLLSGAGFLHPAVRAAVLGALPATDLVALLPHQQGRPAAQTAGHLLSAARAIACVG